MIRKLEVKGLNNRLDVTMEFNKDLNIITGRNGSGKTTLLKLIWYLLSGNLKQAISEIPFQYVSIKTDLFSLSMDRVDGDKDNMVCQFVSVVGKDNTPQNFVVPLRGVDNGTIEGFDTPFEVVITSSLFFPSFRRIEGGFARFSGYTSTDDSRRNQLQQPRKTPADEAAEMLQQAMLQLSARVSVYNHKFIASISTHDIVELLTEKFANISEKTNELYAKLSKEITKKISETKLLDDTSPGLDAIQERINQVNQEQHALLRPISVLREQIGDIFKSKGICVTAEITLGEVNDAIASDKLSAGEKQMLSFLCYNTFSKHAAIFIDEPELSLHVDWQRRLLPTLLEQETGNQFFVATHSPFIYSKYPDKEILLSEDRGDS